jgi:diacylglycerol kinase (ATP)
VNPEAGRGRTPAAHQRLLETFRRDGFADVSETGAAGEEFALAKKAIAEGVTTIVAVGGDGTCSGVASAIVESKAACRLAVIPAGTGNDFAKTLGVDKLSPESIAALVASGRERRIDVGVADGHHFLNSCGFGFDASVLEASNTVRWLKGNAVYVYSALKQLLTYRGALVSADGDVKRTADELLMVTVTNGRWLGGAFRIAPNASVTDGKLDVCFFDECGLVERVRLFAGALRGAHLGMRAVTGGLAAELSLQFTAAPSMEIDGELRKARSSRVEVRCLPGALTVIAAPGFPA